MTTDTDLAILLARGGVRLVSGTPPPGYRKQAQEEAETPFMNRVIAYAKQAGWTLYHTHDSRRSAPGFPDLILMRPGEIIAAECKRNSEKPSPEQVVWLSLFATLPNGEACVWRPRDEAAILARLTQPQRNTRPMPTMAQTQNHYGVWREEA
jgi:hypothetical protein